MRRNPVQEKELVKAEAKRNFHFNWKFLKRRLAKGAQVVVQQALLPGTAINEFAEQGLILGFQALMVLHCVRYLSALFKAIEGLGGFQPRWGYYIRISAGSLGPVGPDAWPYSGTVGSNERATTRLIGTKRWTIRRTVRRTPKRGSRCGGNTLALLMGSCRSFRTEGHATARPDETPLRA